MILKKSEEPQNKTPQRLREIIDENIQILHRSMMLMVSILNGDATALSIKAANTPESAEKILNIPPIKAALEYKAKHLLTSPKSVKPQTTETQFRMDVVMEDGEVFGYGCDKTSLLDMSIAMYEEEMSKK